MAKYDGLIIPRSYNDYINKSDPAGVAQALQLTGVMDNAPTAQSTKPAKSGGIFAANAVIMANNKTLSGVAISAGSVVRVLFTAALTGSDATTGLTLTYNGNTYAVKVGKDGALEALTAHLIEESYIYLQAYTTLELAFDGSQFVVMGNPVVISNADFSIMADGSITYTTTESNRVFIRSIETRQKSLNTGNVEYFDLPALQGVYIFNSSGSYTDATRITAIIYKGMAQTSIAVLDSASVQLSIENGRLKFEYQFQTPDMEFMSLYQMYRFS